MPDVFCNCCCLRLIYIGQWKIIHKSAATAILISQREMRSRYTTAPHRTFNFLLLQKWIHESPQSDSSVQLIVEGYKCTQRQISKSGLYCCTATLSLLSLWFVVCSLCMNLFLSFLLVISIPWMLLLFLWSQCNIDLTLCNDISFHLATLVCLLWFSLPQILPIVLLLIFQFLLLYYNGIKTHCLVYSYRLCYALPSIAAFFSLCY